MHRVVAAAPSLVSWFRGTSPRSPILLSVFAPVVAAAVAACGAGAQPTETPARSDVTLATSAAVSASIGVEGGDLQSEDRERGWTYRLTIPAGALAETVDIRLTPIAAIEGSPLDGGLLGGVELEPNGLSLLGPVTLTIELDAAQQAELRAALDGGEAVVGFEYPGGTVRAADDLALTLVDIAEDHSSLTLAFSSFSGHGGGRASPAKLRARPCPADPVKNAECLINRILHPSGGPADPADPAIRAQIGQVLRDWLDVLEVSIDVATADPATFRKALVEATDWHSIATLYALLTDTWFAPGDELAAEGMRLEGALATAWSDALAAANEVCRTTPRPGPGSGSGLEGLLTILQLHELWTLQGFSAPPLASVPALQPGQFCVQLTLTPDTTTTNPTSVEEGAQAELRFRVSDASLALEVDTQLDAFQAELVANPSDPTALSASPRRLGLSVSVDVSGLRAVPGSTSEGEFVVAMRLFGSTLDYVTATVSLDVTSAVGSPIACAGSPATVLAKHKQVPDDEVMDHIFVRFSEGSTCTIEIGEGDVADAILVADTDSDSVLWDAEATGSGWTEASGYGKDLAAGKYTMTAVSTSTGRSYVVTITVAVSLVDGGPQTTMTVGDVTITPA